MPRLSIARLIIALITKRDAKGCARFLAPKYGHNETRRSGFAWLLVASVVVILPASEGWAVCTNPVGALLWSDPATWGSAPNDPHWFGNQGMPGVGLPTNGAEVHIPHGQVVVLDIDSTQLAGISIAGELHVDCMGSVVSMQVTWMDVSNTGLFQIGQTNASYDDAFTLTLSDQYVLEHCALHASQYGAGCVVDPMRFSDNPGQGSPMTLRVFGGRLVMHGKERLASWAKMPWPVGPGGGEFRVDRSVDWDGDRVVFAPTDFAFDEVDDTTVSAPWGNLPTQELNIGSAFNFYHYGSVESYTVGSGTYTIDLQGEVALINRNLRVVAAAVSEANSWGQLRLMTDDAGAAPHIELDWVEFEGLGHENAMGVYPVHFHLAGDVTGSHVKHCSIHDSLFRALTIHGTNGLHVEGNVAYHTRGHAFYLENGTEEDNSLLDNLAIRTVATDTGTRIVDSDSEPGGFYISNFNNRIEGNHSAGSQGHGFYIACVGEALYPTTPGMSRCLLDPPAAASSNPPRGFIGNVAHSNTYIGLYLNRYAYEDGGKTNHAHVTWPAGTSALFTDFTAYKNREYGVWVRAHGKRVDPADPTSMPAQTILDDFKTADNRSGFYLASGGWQKDDDQRIVIRSSLIIGESQGNVGNYAIRNDCLTANPLPDECVYERSLPLSEAIIHPITLEPLSLQPLVGVDVYDGMNRGENTVFARFRAAVLTSGTRYAGALSQTSTWQFDGQDTNPWAIDSRNHVTGLEFDDATRVYMRDPIIDIGTGAADEAGALFAVVYDLDGSLTGDVDVDGDTIPDGGSGAWVTFATGLLHSSASIPATTQTDPITGEDWRVWILEPGDVGVGQVQLVDKNKEAFTQIIVNAPHNSASETVGSPALSGDQFAFNVLTTDLAARPPFRYDIDYPLGAVIPDDLRLLFRFANPVHGVEISVPYPCVGGATPSPSSIRASDHFGHQRWLTPAANLAGLTAGTYFCDVANQRLYLLPKLANAGSLFDFLETSLRVLP